MFLRSSDVSPGPAHLTSSGPSLFYERACLCANRCKLPLCVKLENPELSREECHDFFYCSLLHSDECVYTCVWERKTESERWKWTWGENKCESWGQMPQLVINSFRNTHVDNCCVRFQSALRGGVCRHPAGGHMIRIRHLTHASSGKLSSCWMTTTQAWAQSASFPLCAEFPNSISSLSPIVFLTWLPGQLVATGIVEKHQVEPRHGP